MSDTLSKTIRREGKGGEGTVQLYSSLVPLELHQLFHWKSLDDFTNKTQTKTDAPVPT